MPPPSPDNAPAAVSGRTSRVLFLCTTYPAPTETFVRREVEALRAAGAELDVVSVWGGGGGDVWRFRFWELVKLLWWLPYWLVRRPGVLCDLMQSMILRPMPSALNAGENLLGFGFALIHAQKIGRRRYRHAHAAWAGLPAAAAWLLDRLTGLPYSVGAHAYDLFEGGGDWLLSDKTARARFVRTSTGAGRRRLLRSGVPEGKVALIRRGLVAFPPVHPMRAVRVPLRILAVGRFVEKMGYHALVGVLEQARAAGLAFEGRLIGEGPARREIADRLAARGLATCVRFEGRQPFTRVLEALAWADVLLFTGVVARNGDRAGLPNAVAEAMAAGVPVVASRVGGVAEAVEHERSGLLVEGPGAAAELLRLARDDDLYRRLQEGGREWTLTHFDAAVNMRALRHRIDASAEDGAERICL
ncbi:MAG: glycosyltransferase [Opitutales bacterium]|nr:glycosyltransferase [Opitutales bacterium]